MGAPPAVFFSYVRADDAAERGRLSEIRKAVEIELRTLSGEDWNVFQDVEDIEVGQQWKKRLAEEVGCTTFFVAILTPRYLKRPICRDELSQFLQREKELGRNDLVFPVLYLDTPVLQDADLQKSDPLAATLADRQHLDWRDLRRLAIRTARVTRRINELARGIMAAHARERRASRNRASIADETLEQTGERFRTFEGLHSDTEEAAGDDELRKQSNQELPQHAKVVFPLHGIRTRAEWQGAFAEVAQQAGWMCRLKKWYFGRFSLLRFLWPFGRAKKIRWFEETYYDEVNTRGLDLDADQLPSVVAHSFGTYIVGYAMLKYEYLRFNKVILCGSILPREFPWDVLLERGQVRAVRNEYGVKDIWVRWVRFFVRRTGPSGADGFTGRHPRLQQKRFDYNHSEYFGKGHMEAFWIPFLERPDPIAPLRTHPVPEPKTTPPLALYFIFFVAIVTMFASLYEPLRRTADPLLSFFGKRPSPTAAPIATPTVTASPTVNAIPVSTPMATPTLTPTFTTTPAVALTGTPGTSVTPTATLTAIASTSLTPTPMSIATPATSPTPSSDTLNRSPLPTATRTASKIGQVVKPKAAGYAFYGTESDEGWFDRYFERSDSSPDAIPQPGIKIQALGDVHVRSDVIKYNRTKERWINAPSTGVVKKGQTLRVLEVIRIPNNRNFIWIRFEEL